MHYYVTFRWLKGVESRKFIELKFNLKYSSERNMQRHQLFRVLSCKTKSTPEKADVAVWVLEGRERQLYGKPRHPHRSRFVRIFLWSSTAKLNVKRERAKSRQMHMVHIRVSIYLYPGVVGRPCGFAKRVESNLFPFLLAPTSPHPAFRGSISCFIDS